MIGRKLTPAQLAASLAAVAALASPGGAAIAQNQAQTKIVTGVVAHAATQLPAYWATESGCAKENGFEIDMLPVGGGGAQQLAAGALNVSQSGFPDYFRAIDQGAEMKLFINNNSAPPYSVHAKPAIKKIADLKGRTITIGGVKDVTLIYIQPLLASAGLKASDVDFIYAKATADRFTALNAGGVDAAILNPPASFRADGLGFTKLGEISDYMKDYPFTVWAVHTGWAAKNRGAVVGFTVCHIRGVEWANQPENKTQAVDMILKYAKASPADAAKTYDYFSKLKFFSRDAALTEAIFDKMKGGLLQMGDVREPVPPLAKFFDASFLTEAEQKMKAKAK